LSWGPTHPIRLALPAPHPGHENAAVKAGDNALNTGC
jgi:hypothetical protein